VNHNAKRIFAAAIFLTLLGMACLIAKAECCRREILYQSSLRERLPNGQLDNHGIYCFWRRPDQTELTERPTLWQMCCGARPVQLWLNSGLGRKKANPPVTPERVQRTARAIGFFHSLEFIDISDSGEQGMAFLEEIGPHESLRQLFCFRVPITDAIVDILKGFPSLKDLAIGTSSRFTATGFPQMKYLETADFNGSSVPLANVENVLQGCPKLQYLGVELFSLTREEEKHLKAIKSKYPHLDGPEFGPSIR
jgi:hypothetical protein